MKNLSILAALLAFAICTPSTAVPNTKQVWLANSPILTVRASSDNMSIAQRVNALQGRLNNLLAFGRATPEFSTMKQGMDTNTYVGKEFLMTVTAADAKAHHTTSALLAETYIERMNRAIPAVISLYRPSGVSMSNIHVARNTVVRLTIPEDLSSATAHSGDYFYAYQSGSSSAFPADTRFTGRINSVTSPSESSPGSMDISFVAATLPDGTRLPLSGRLISLEDSSIATDPSSGRMVYNGQANRSNANRAAATGLAVGSVLDREPAVGAIIGAGSGHASSSDGSIEAGTGPAMVLSASVTLPDTTAGAIETF